ncbi:MAG: type II secretion system F family protein [Candidatus Diapherotrites archaeon]|nr:type II secretion system F family protein [Candidatus Diapherotrites archaeon]
MRSFCGKLLCVKGRTFESFVSENLLSGAGLAAAFFGVLFLLKLPAGHILFACIALLFVPLASRSFAVLYRFGVRRRAMEEMIPDLLLQASVFPPKTPMAKTLEAFASEEFGGLGKEFGKCAAGITAGKSVAQAFADFSERADSAIADRALNLLLHGYESGADMSAVFRETAEDLLETASAFRERQAGLLVQKYTLLFAGAIIVPAILGMIISMVSGMHFSEFAEFGLGVPAEQRKQLFDAAVLGSQAYIAEYAILASAFLGFQEKDWKKGCLYAAFMLPAGFLAYFAAGMFF